MNMEFPPEKAVMPESQRPEIEFEHDDFDFETIEEELRVDERCRALLERFYKHLQDSGRTPKQASDMAYSADYYLRDYLLDFARRNVARPEPGIVRCFAATWFVVNNLDPEIATLERHLEAIRELYRFLYGSHLITKKELAFIEEEAGQVEYYRQRIERFIGVSGDGYVEWEAECPSKSLLQKSLNQSPLP